MHCLLHFGGLVLFFLPQGTVMVVPPQRHETVSVKLQG